jgi:hypothetical protein
MHLHFSIIIEKMMNKVLATSRRTLLLCSLHQRVMLGMRILPAIRPFHAGHHHPEDDGKESHSDFKAKTKTLQTQEQLNA